MKLNNMDESLDHDLQDPEYITLYLNDALHEGSPEEFYLALRNVIRANQEMSQVMDSSELGKERISLALSESANSNNRLKQLLEDINSLQTLGGKNVITNNISQWCQENISKLDSVQDELIEHLLNIIQPLKKIKLDSEDILKNAADLESTTLRLKKNRESKQYPPDLFNEETLSLLKKIDSLQKSIEVELLSIEPEVNMVYNQSTENYLFAGYKSLGDSIKSYFLNFIKPIFYRLKKYIIFNVYWDLCVFMLSWAILTNVLNWITTKYKYQQ